MKIQNKKDEQKVSQGIQEAQWKEKYFRALADYQNLEKHIREVRGQEIKYAGKTVIEKLLPVVDVLEKVAQISTDQGIQLAVKLFWDVLKNEGVKKIEVIGKKFDPHTMECIEVVDGENEMVKEEVSPGYMIYEKLLRPSGVKVGKKENQKQNNNDDSITKN